MALPNARSTRSAYSVSNSFLLLQDLECGSVSGRLEILGLDADAKVPERLQNVEPRMVEHISNEILSKEAAITFQDIGGHGSASPIALFHICRIAPMSTRYSCYVILQRANTVLQCILPK